MPLSLRLIIFVFYFAEKNKKKREKKRRKCIFISPMYFLIEKCTFSCKVGGWISMVVNILSLHQIFL